MAAFYGGVLGLAAIEDTRTDTWIEFHAGSVVFALHAIPPHIAEEIEIASPPVIRETTPIKLTFAVDDVAVECERLAALQVTIIRRPWGGYDGIDPEGNVFGLCSAAD